MAKQELVPYVHSDGKKWEHYFVDPKSQVIYFLKSHKGQKIKFSTRERVPNGLKAKRYANDQLEKRIGARKSYVTPLIRDELAKWIAVKESEGLAYDTMNNVKRARVQIEEFWGTKLTLEINRESIAEWILWWEKNRPEIEMENAIKYMRNFCRYLSEKSLGDRPLLPAVPKIKDPNAKRIRSARKKKKENVISPADLFSILRAAPGDDERTLVMIMYTMATRVSETLSLKFDDTILLESDPPVYRWRDGQNKADHVGEHALHPVLIERLKELKARRKREGTNLLFPQKWNIHAPLKEQQIDWNGWRRRAKVSHHWTPHTFRHTCLTNLFNDPANSQAVICKLYRVSLNVALETYVKVTKESIMRMREAIKVEV